MNQVVLVGLISLSCICIFFIYQNIKLKRMYTEEFGRLNKNMSDMTRLVSLNSEKNNVLRHSAPFHPDSNSNHQSADVSNDANDSKYNKLKTNYEEYVKTNFEPYEFENVPEEIKEGIEHLTGEGYVETTEPLHITGEDEVEQLHITGDHEDPGNFVNELAGDNIEDELDVVEPLHISDEIASSGSLYVGDEENSSEHQFTEDHEPASLSETNLENEVISQEEISPVSLESYDEEINIVNDVINILNTNEPVLVEKTFSVNDDNNLEFDEEENNLEFDEEENNLDINTKNISLDNFAKSSNTNDLENMTVKELQQLARDNNVKVKGKKNELIIRLKEKLLVN
jgi:hypothetical protein